jgi:thiol-disulfide isomerase/thioredoxin
MKVSLLTVALVIGYGAVSAQDSKDIVREVMKAQLALSTVSYTLERVDTLLTGDIRTMSGRVMIMTDREDSLWGFKFRAEKDGEPGERVYDGLNGYVTDPDKRSYRLISTSSGIRSLLNGGGGHLVFSDLVRLDTTGAKAVTVSQDRDFYYLSVQYPDYEPENVIRRYKLFSIDKKSMLPVAMRNHQEAYGKVQDLFYQVKELRINDPAFDYDFSSLPFLHEFRQEIVTPGLGLLPIMSLKDKETPPFELSSFTGEEVNSEDLRGKAVLIDLWEVWCSPCIASMPKVEALYEKYKDRGLLVYGITNDLRGLSAAKAMVQKKGFKLPMLIGDEQFKKDYFISSTPLPMYILIDRNGKVSMLSGGFTDEIEKAVKEVL